jgi:thioredoxin 1
MINTTKPKFKDLIMESEKPVLVDFYADWCGPCKSMSPVISEIASEYADKIKVIKINVDRNPQISNTYNISGIPTLMLFHKGNIKWQQSGLIPAAEIRRIIDKI